MEGSLTYPGLKALAAHRISHFSGAPLSTLKRVRMVDFGMDSNQRLTRAQVLKVIFIDHGSGLVIGETTVVERCYALPRCHFRWYW